MRVQMLQFPQFRQFISKMWGDIFVFAFLWTLAVFLYKKKYLNKLCISIIKIAHISWKRGYNKFGLKVQKKPCICVLCICRTYIPIL